MALAVVLTSAEPGLKGVPWLMTRAVQDVGVAEHWTEALKEPVISTNRDAR